MEGIESPFGDAVPDRSHTAGIKKEHDMKWMTRVFVIVVSLAVIGFVSPAFAEDETPAQAGEQVAVESQFVRVAANAEGFVVVGYEQANENAGRDWMLLNVGITLMHGVKPQTLTRDQVKVVTPAGTIISMATQEEFEKAAGEVAAMIKENAMMGEAINYFPREANLPCRIGFFSDPSAPRADLSFDQVGLASSNACMGMIFFQIPGGIQYGDYNFDVHFAESIVKVPMKIMTKEEAQAFEKQWKEELKQEREEKHDK